MADPLTDHPVNTEKNRKLICASRCLSSDAERPMGWRKVFAEALEQGGKVCLQMLIIFRLWLAPSSADEFAADNVREARVN